MNRRDFLRRSAVAAAGAGVAIGAVSEGCSWGQQGAQAPAPAKADIPKRVLGRTGLKVTELSFGGTRLTDRAVLNYGIDRGINFIHVGPDYARGKALPEYGAVTKTRRDEVVLGLKLHPREDELDDVLARLNTKFVDMLSPGVHTVEEIGSAELKEGLLRMKEKGKTKWVGFAVHNHEPEVLAKAVEMGYLDLVLLAYNPGNRALLDPIVEQAEQIGMGLIAMKTLKRVPREEQQTAVKSVLNNPKVDTLIKGFTTKEEVDTFIEWTLTRTAGVTPADERRVATKMAGLACYMCGNCSICPRRVAVTDIFRYQYYAEDGQLESARDKYARLAACERADNCDDCGLCEPVCSSGLPIRRRLKQAHALLV